VGVDFSLPFELQIFAKSTKCEWRAQSKGAKRETMAAITTTTTTTMTTKYERTETGNTIKS